MLADPRLNGRGNGPVRTAVMQRMQQSHGNRALRRALHHLQRAPDPANAPTATTAPTATAAPTEDYVVPFDRNPLVLAGEEVLFNDVFKHATPADFQLAYTGTGGTFDTLDTGSANKTVAGLNSGNLPFFVKSTWDGKTAVTVQLQVQRTSDKSAVLTYNWTFGKKVNIPTTITQSETEGDRPLGSAYTYTLGPHVGAAGTDSYLHETVLERFEAPTCNITLAELKPEFKTAHPGITTTEQITNHFWPGGSGSNGTFTISAGDHMYDQHGGGMPDKDVFEAALITMKEIHHDLPQIYEAKPGVALGRFLIRRILKTDGSKTLNKMKK
jgi:hypothetical protein